MATKNPTTVTAYGRLSFPVFSYQEAVTRNQKSKYPKPDAAAITPEFNLLLEQAQFEKVRDHVLNVFLPHCLDLFKAGGELGKKSALDDASVKKLVKAVEAAEWDSQPPYLPFKPVSEKSLELAPASVVQLKVNGNRGLDIEQKAIVNSEDELLVPDPDLLTYPVIRPIGQTVHSLYPGCYTVATLNLYAYISGKLPGFSASAGVAIFKMDADRFGGGVAVDEDEVFMD